MALIYIIRAAGQCHIVGLSTDTKPVAVNSNSFSFLEVDTGRCYLCDGTTWVDTTVTGGSAAWGAITGALSAQTDLQAALDAKGTSNFSGAYGALSGIPTTFAPIIGSGGTQAVAGNDSRLTDARTPTPLTGDVTTVNNAATIPAGRVTDTMRIQTSSATPATTGVQSVSMTNDILTITPTGACTFNATGGRLGRIITFSITTAGTSSFVLTFGTNFRKAGTLVTGTVAARFFAVTFRCINGTIWQEIGRTLVQT